MQIQSVAIAIHLPSPPLLICIYIIVIYLFSFCPTLFPLRCFKILLSKWLLLYYLLLLNTRALFNKKHNINCQTYCYRNDLWISIDVWVHYCFFFCHAGIIRYEEMSNENNLYPEILLEMNLVYAMPRICIDR